MLSDDEYFDDEDDYEQNMTDFLKGTTNKSKAASSRSRQEQTVPITQDPSYQEIRIDRSPTQPRWALLPLYKIAANGDLLYWQVKFDGVSNLEISQGYNGGIIRTDTIDISPDQAFREARRLYKFKYREGYQPGGDISPPLVKGMKGYEYKYNSIKSWPVYTQPKLHGIRMLANVINTFECLGGKIKLRSWLNNPFSHLMHIEEELREFFEYLPRNATLDGELYNHHLRFSTLTSIVKTTKQVHPKINQIQYWIFDIDYQDPDGTPYEKRYELLVNAFRRYLQDRSPTDDPTDVSVLPKFFRIVPVQLARNHDEVLAQHHQHVSNGFEGIMIKKISNGATPGTKPYQETLYKSNKCNHILKYKQFRDEEAIIIGVQSPTTLLVQDKNGHRYPIRMRGTMENPELTLGKEVTIRYQEVISMGEPSVRTTLLPKDPVGIAIRDYE
jgi:hypothetical protein